MANKWHGWDAAIVYLSASEVLLLILMLLLLYMHYLYLPQNRPVLLSHVCAMYTRNVYPVPRPRNPNSQCPVQSPSAKRVS